MLKSYQEKGSRPECVCSVSLPLPLSCALSPSDEEFCSNSLIFFINMYSSKDAVGTLLKSRHPGNEYRGFMVVQFVSAWLRLR